MAMPSPRTNIVATRGAGSAVSPIRFFSSRRGQGRDPRAASAARALHRRLSSTPKKGGDGLTRLPTAAPAIACFRPELQPRQPIHGGSMKYKFAALAAAVAGITLLGAAPAYAEEEEDARARADVRAQIGETDPDYGPSFNW